MQNFRLLCLGDTVGEKTLALLQGALPALSRLCGATMTVVNGENSRLGSGNGLSREDAEMLFACGADVITGGNHSFRQRSVYEFLDDCPYLLRPLNYPPASPGKGYTILNAFGTRVLVMNALGRTFMEPCDCPFRTIERVLESEKGHFDISVLDFHGEASSEKFALASYFDGRIDVIFGTHTHVQTADEQILPKGTAYITDVGMCGPRGSCLGVEPSCIAEKLRSGMPQKFILSENPVYLQGILVEFRGTFHGLRVDSVRRLNLSAEALQNGTAVMLDERS